MQQDNNQLFIIIDNFLIGRAPYVNVKQLFVPHMFLGVLEQVAHSELVVVLISLFSSVARIKVNQADIVFVVFLAHDKQIVSFSNVGLVDLIGFVWHLYSMKLVVVKRI